MFVTMLQEQTQVRADTGGYLTVKEYAETKNVTVQAVYGKINRKTISTKIVGTLVLVKDI